MPRGVKIQDKMLSSWINYSLIFQGGLVICDVILIEGDTFFVKVRDRRGGGVEKIGKTRDVIYGRPLWFLPMIDKAFKADSSPSQNSQWKIIRAIKSSVSFLVRGRTITNRGTSSNCCWSFGRQDEILIGLQAV
jgi:hypothetical protein